LSRDHHSGFERPRPFCTFLLPPSSNADSYRNQHLSTRKLESARAADSSRRLRFVALRGVGGTARRKRFSRRNRFSAKTLGPKDFVAPTAYRRAAATKPSFGRSKKSKGEDCKSYLFQAPIPCPRGSGTPMPRFDQDRQPGETQAGDFDSGGRGLTACNGP
jgi:hypothetical protein